MTSPTQDKDKDKATAQERAQERDRGTTRVEDVADDDKRQATRRQEDRDQQERDRLMTESMEAQERAYSAQRDLAEHREQQRFEREQRDREEISRNAMEQAQALRTIGEQARGGVLELQDTTRGVARGAARTATALVPPALTQPGLLVDAVFTPWIALLTLQRDFVKTVLHAGRQAADF